MTVKERSSALRANARFISFSAFPNSVCSVLSASFSLLCHLGRGCSRHRQGGQEEPRRRRGRVGMEDAPPHPPTSRTACLHQSLFLSVFISLFSTLLVSFQRI